MHDISLPHINQVEKQSMLTVRTMLAVILENELKMDDEIGFKMGMPECNIDLDVLETLTQKSPHEELKKYYFFLGGILGKGE